MEAFRDFLQAKETSVRQESLTDVKTERLNQLNSQLQVLDELLIPINENINKTRIKNEKERLEKDVYADYPYTKYMFKRKPPLTTPLDIYILHKTPVGGWRL